MRMQRGKAAAAGVLCAIAATVAVWSGPLFTASRALHASSPAQVRTDGHSSSAR